jgi:small membrane protein
MTVFQWIAIPLLSWILLLELAGLIFRDSSRRRLRMIRAMVWTAAILLIAFPYITQPIAESLGIGRGVDLILYLAVLAFTWVSFHLYSKNVHLERKLTELVRVLAIQDAKQTPDDVASENPHKPR